jgi:hypothetical protein
MTPRLSKLATPNTVLATPGRNGETPGATPGSQMVSRNGGPGQTPTPMRDAFGLNDMSDNFSVSDSTSVSSRYERERESLARMELERSLKGLPEPVLGLGSGLRVVLIFSLPFDLTLTLSLTLRFA